MASFAKILAEASADAILISGDISLSARITADLEEIARHVPDPVYFVLGNHDYYGGSIENTRTSVAEACQNVDNLHYLSQCDVVPLTTSTCLMGHDGWGDARAADFLKSTILLKDYRLIEELSGVSAQVLEGRLKALGDEAARHTAEQLDVALQRFDHVVFLTHVPPFRDAAVYEHRQSDDNWAPHFVCQAVGDVLEERMAANADKTLQVLCGHTHGDGEGQILPNLEWHTGGAEYRKPRIHHIFDVS